MSRPKFSLNLLLVVVAASVMNDRLRPVAAQDLQLPRRMFRESVSIATDSQVMKRLGTARDHLDAQEWSQAIPILQQIIETGGDSLLAVETGRYWNAADFCHLLISGIPRDGLAVYRDRVDPQAADWLKLARKTHDPALFEQIVRVAFNSSSGDDALWHLGSLAFEQGRYAVARQHWQLLAAPVRPQDSGDADAAGMSYLTYPDSAYAAAVVRARLILCTIFEGDRNRVERELAVFEQLHADAEGDLAGQSGPLSEILRAVLEESQKWWLNRSVPDEVLTFAGQPTRNPLPVSEHSPGPRLWSRRLPEIRFRGPALPAVTGPQRLLSYFPVVYRDTVYLCNSHSIFALDLATGDSPRWLDQEITTPSGIEPQRPADEPDQQTEGEEPAVLPPDRNEFDGETRTDSVQVDREETRIFTNSTEDGWRIIRNPVGITRYTMTLADGRLYARMGPPVSRRSPHEGSTVSEIVGLDIESGQGLLVFRVTSDVLDPDASSPEATAWSFEGTPVVENGRVYISARRATPEDEVVIACFDASSSQLLWQQRLCSNLRPLSDRTSLLEHRLLTFAEGRLFLATGTGAIACLDAESGRILWLFTYDAENRSGGRHTSFLDDISHPARNGLMPCLYHRGMVFAATTDSSSLFALDATTGELVWQIEQEPGEWLRHLLGVVDGRLIACGNHLVALDIFSGRTLWKISHPDPDGWTHGRGVLSRQSVYWPLRHEVLRVSLSSGKIQRRFQLTRSDGLQGGHLLIVGERMLVVSHDQISALRNGEPPDHQATGDDQGFGEVPSGLRTRHALRAARAAEDTFQPLDAVKQFQSVLDDQALLQLVPERRSQARYVAARGVARSARVLVTVTSDQIKRSWLETLWRTITACPQAFSPRETVQAALDYVDGTSDPRVLQVVTRFLQSSGLDAELWEQALSEGRQDCGSVAAAFRNPASIPGNPATPGERIRDRTVRNLIPADLLNRSWNQEIRPSTKILVPQGLSGGPCRRFLLQDAVLTCHDAADGRILWETAAAQEVTRAVCLPAMTADGLASGDRLLLMGTQSLHCRRAETGEICWIRRWAGPVQFDWTDRLSRLPELLAVTADSVAALSLIDGTQRWQFPPQLQHTGEYDAGQNGARSLFYSDEAVAFFQSRELPTAFLIDLQTGCPIARTPASRTLPQTGRLVFEPRSRTVSVPGLPAQEEAVSWNVAGISRANRLQVARFHNRKKPLPTRTRRLGTGLGQPVLLTDESPFTVLIENGLMAERIDVRTATSIWRVRLRSLLQDPVRMTALTSTSLFAVSDGFLSQFDLTDGKRGWQRYLGEGHWQIVQAMEKSVLLAGNSLVTADPTCRLIICDAGTGQPVQQLHFAGHVQTRDIGIGSGFVLVRSGDRLYGLTTAGNHSPMPTTSFRLR